MYKYDFICISETFLDSSFESDDKNFMLEGYNLIRSDHPSNIKMDGVCIYYKESLAVRLVDITSLPECLVCELTIQNKKGYVAVMCRSPSQSSIEFESFLSGFEDMLSSVLFSKPQFTVILGDFNAGSSSCWSDDITNPNSNLIDSLTTTHGFKQLVSDATHILPQSLTCIDLIFTDQLNYAIDCGTHSSFNQNCHHQITFCKLNLKVEYPPPYQRLVWNFKKSNNGAIKRAIELVNWNFLFSHKNVHEQVVIFNQTLMNIFSNYIPNKLITVDDKDPPWMNEYINKKILDKKIACTFFNTNKNYDSYLKLQTISTELSEMILKRKNDYHRQLSDKLNDPETSAKAYWSILKTLYNGKKIPLILPILVNNKLISNFKEKANYFNNFFTSHCTLISNGSVLSNSSNSVSNVSLSSIHFEDQDILKIICSVNNKAYGYDDISIRLLKLCDSSIVRPLSIIFKNCLQTGAFPNN